MGKPLVMSAMDFQQDANTSNALWRKEIDNYLAPGAPQGPAMQDSFFRAYSDFPHDEGMPDEMCQVED
jgi:hypothetical protein